MASTQTAIPCSPFLSFCTRLSQHWRDIGKGQVAIQGFDSERRHQVISNAFITLRDNRYLRLEEQTIQHRAVHNGVPALRSWPSLETWTFFLSPFPFLRFSADSREQDLQRGICPQVRHLKRGHCIRCPRDCQNVPITKHLVGYYQKFCPFLSTLFLYHIQDTDLLIYQSRRVHTRSR